MPGLAASFEGGEVQIGEAGHGGTEVDAFHAARSSWYVFHAAWSALVMGRPMPGHARAVEGLIEARSATVDR